MSNSLKAAATGDVLSSIRKLVERDRAQTGPVDPVGAASKEGRTSASTPDLTSARSEDELRWEADAASDAGIPAMPSFRVNHQTMASSKQTVGVEAPVADERTETDDGLGANDVDLSAASALDVPEDAVAAQRKVGHKGGNTRRAGFGFGAMRPTEIEPEPQKGKPELDEADPSTEMPSVDLEAPLMPTPAEPTAIAMPVRVANLRDSTAGRPVAVATAAPDFGAVPAPARRTAVDLAQESASGAGSTPDQTLPGLEDRIAKIVLRELRGALGESIGREVRALVRREVDLCVSEWSRD